MAHSRESTALTKVGPFYLPEWALWAIAYPLFLWSSLVLVGLWLVTPDLLLSGWIYLAAGLLVRLRNENSYAKFLALGLVLGAAYLCKAVMFPLAFVFLAIALFSGKPVASRVPPVLLATAVFPCILTTGFFAFPRKRAAHLGRLWKAYLRMAGQSRLPPDQRPGRSAIASHQKDPGASSGLRVCPACRRSLSSLVRPFLLERRTARRLQAALASARSRGKPGHVFQAVAGAIRLACRCHDPRFDGQVSGDSGHCPKLAADRFLSNTLRTLRARAGKTAVRRSVPSGSMFQRGGRNSSARTGRAFSVREICRSSYRGHDDAFYCLAPPGHGIGGALARESLAPERTHASGRRLGTTRTATWRSSRCDRDRQH
jgi:hypothetical protein